MLKRLPNFQSVLQVYAAIAVMLSAWTITAFLWKLSAWLLILNLVEIFAIFSYAMLANFIESMIVILLLLVLCLLLPPRIFRDDFVVRGTILSAGLIGSLMAFVGLQMQYDSEIGIGLLIGPLIVIVLTALMLGFVSKIHFLTKVILWVTDRLTVFLFILLPLFVILSGYVIFRNIV